jgi:DNA-nicking Smr family endonuclease
MTRDGRPRRRRLTEDERALWRGVTRAITPLKRRAHKSDPSELEAAPEPSGKPRKTKPAPAASAAPARSVLARKEPPLAPIERRVRQRLARGLDAIDRRIDLHGFTQSEAHAALLQFLRRAQADGVKVVLVITGKGGGAHDTGRGVLKRQVPLWLALPDFRPFVLGFDQAAVAHGGAGALYVRVRRGR